MPRIRRCLAALIIFLLTGCTDDQKIWIVVSIKKPNGELAQISFDDPIATDKDVQACILSLKTEGVALMEEINGMPGMEGSQFLSETCVLSEKEPTNQV
jgi:hypothetical protein